MTNGGRRLFMMNFYYHSDERLTFKGRTESRGICAKKRTSVKAFVLMATPGSTAMGGEIGGHR